jgi:hypothetical protein
MFNVSVALAIPAGFCHSRVTTAAQHIDPFWRGLGQETIKERSAYDSRPTSDKQDFAVIILPYHFESLKLVQISLFERLSFLGAWKRTLYVDTGDPCLKKLPVGRTEE